MTAAHAPRKRRSASRAGLRRRYWAERRFRAYGLIAVLFGIAFVLFLFATIIGKGASVFRQSYVQLEVFYDPAIVDPDGTRQPRGPRGRGLSGAGARARSRRASRTWKAGATTRELTRLVSSGGAFDLRDRAC